MNFTAYINVMPLDNLLDPQGKAVLGGLSNLGITQVEDVRVGKHIVLKLEASDAVEATELAKMAASKLLANQVMEQFEIVVK